MFTSNFKECWKDPRAVAISVGKPRGWKGRHYPPLAPTWAMLKMSEEEYETVYRRMLAELDPKKVYDDLGEEAGLLCWEGFNDRCHRRLVAEWLEENLGIEIPELGHDRKESVLFTEQLRKPKSKAKRLLAQLALFNF